MNLSMLNQARELKARMDRVQKELAKTVIEVSSGKGSVTIAITGQQKIKSISISPEVINPEKAAQLETLVLKTINDAMEKSQKLAAKQLKEITGGLKIPGLF